MNIARIVLILGFLALATAIAWAMAADARSLSGILAELVGQPWTVVTLIDLYFGFLITSIMIVITERNPARGVLWALPIFVLGNLWAAVWLMIRLPALVSRLRPAA